MAKIVVAGYMIRYPVAGMQFAFFHYVLGLHRLGHSIVYIEESGWPHSCYDPYTQTYSDDPTIGLRSVESLMKTYGVRGKVCYVNRDSGTSYGAEWKEVKEMLSSADLLLNIGGVSWLPEFLLAPRRIWIDLDPFFTQIGQFGREGREHYHAYYTYGTNIGRPECTIPDDGIDWQPTVPPVVSDIWQSEVSRRDIAEPSFTAPFTTIANWSAYGTTDYEGETYGQKDEEFLRLIQLPKHISQEIELALSGADADVWAMLQANGWSLRDGSEVSRDMSTYQAYITQSRGEFSTAKNAYVKTWSGWFSDRTVSYLAAARPVIIQDTGYRNQQLSNVGIVTFSSLEEAVAGIEAVNSDFETHSREARKLADSIFGYQVVLPRLLKNFD